MNAIKEFMTIKGNDKPFNRNKSLISKCFKFFVAFHKVVVRNNRTSSDPDKYVNSYVESYIRFSQSIWTYSIEPSVDDFLEYITLGFPTCKVFEIFKNSGFDGEALILKKIHQNFNKKNFDSGEGIGFQAAIDKKSKSLNLIFNAKLFYNFTFANTFCLAEIIKM